MLRGANHSAAPRLRGHLPLRRCAHPLPSRERPTCHNAALIQDSNALLQEHACQGPAVPEEEEHVASISGREHIRDSHGRVRLRNLTLPELELWCMEIGEPSKRARHLWRWLYGGGRLVRNLDEASHHPGNSDCFSAEFKSKQVHQARDGTRKLVFSVHPQDGGASGTIETVLIPMTSRQGTNLRYTICLSTQVGCAMNCQFCYTGRMGLLGNLTTAQIVEQVVEARRLLSADPSSPRIHNVVFMGMGEPLHNYDSLMAALDILCEGSGLALSRSKVIVSTVGLVPELRRLVASGKAKLAVSLHATTDEVRSWIVPTNRRYPLADLLGALEELFPLDGRKGDKFVVIEYVMLKGVNDTVEDAHRLLHLTRNIYCMINLIVFNAFEGTIFRGSDDEQVRAFRGVLLEGGKVCTLRISKGDDSMAACGQLGNPSLAPRPAPVMQPPPAFQASMAAAAAVPTAGQ